MSILREYQIINKSSYFKEGNILYVSQLLKYLNKEITHTKATFKVIPNGVLNRLAKPTSRTEENAKMSIKERYPDHANALARAGLGMKNSNLEGIVG